MRRANKNYIYIFCHESIDSFVFQLLREQFEQLAAPHGQKEEDLGGPIHIGRATIFSLANIEVEKEKEKL